MVQSMLYFIQDNISCVTQKSTGDLYGVTSKQPPLEALYNEPKHTKIQCRKRKLFLIYQSAFST